MPHTTAIFFRFCVRDRDRRGDIRYTRVFGTADPPSDDEGDENEGENEGENQGENEGENQGDESNGNANQGNESDSADGLDEYNDGASSPGRPPANVGVIQIPRALVCRTPHRSISSSPNRAAVLEKLTR